MFAYSFCIEIFDTLISAECRLPFHCSDITLRILEKLCSLLIGLVLFRYSKIVMRQSRNAGSCITRSKEVSCQIFLKGTTYDRSLSNQEHCKLVSYFTI